MSAKVLSNDLDNCLIDFNRKVLVTNLLDEYGGLLEEIAKTVQQFLASEEQKGKEFEKMFLLRGKQLESENEVVSLVPGNKLNQQKEQIRDAHSMLYSAEIVGGSKSPPTEFKPLKEMAIKLDSLVVSEVQSNKGLLPISNGTTSNGVAKEQAVTSKKSSNGAIGSMFKKQEASAKLSAKTPEKTSPKKPEASPKKLEASPKKKTEKPRSLGAMFKKQEATATKKSPEAAKDKKPNSLGAMFKKQEATAAAKKSSTETKDKTDSKKGLSGFLTKKDEEKETKSPAPKKTQATKIKEEPQAANVSVNLFEESESSSDDEEALDALKREILTDDDDEDKPSTSNKRRRIIDSDDEDSCPEAKIDKKETIEKEEEVELIEEDEEPAKSETYMDEEGFIVTKKAKRKSVPKRPNPTPVKIKTPSKVKKESPKSPSPTKKRGAPSKTPAPKTKQGTIMNFFQKK